MPDNPATTKTDFPDWLSPMLVKELRQGVRTRVFVSLFILLQVLMLLDISLTLLVAAHGESTSAGTAFFWIMVGLPVLVVLPINGMNAVSGEIKANTLELTFLTRLTAFRIIAGKWLATFAQTLLLVCAVLPYLVLRYFVGGVNVTGELTILASMLGGSALLSAWATGISPYPARVVRPLAVVLFIGFLFFGLGGFVETVAGSRVVASAGPHAMEITGLVLCGAVVLILMLEVGASRIAPPAENHSAIMRLLALGGFVVALVVGLFLRRSLMVTTTAFVIAVMVCAVALGENPRWIPGLFRPFATRGLAGWIAGRLLYPGWYTGVLFTLAVFGLFGAVFAYQGTFGAAGHIVRFVSVGGTLLLPAALTRCFFPKAKQPAAIFLLVNALCILVTIFAMICDNILKTSLKELISFLPLSTLIMSIGDTDLETANRGTAVLITTVASLAALLVASRRPFQLARRAENESLQLPAPDESSLA